MAGITTRTLHYYDQVGLLKPSIRTEARYRYYGKDELLRLQQILFYKELDFPLGRIMDILDDPDFDLIRALSNHKAALRKRRDRIDTLLATIDKTIHYQSKKDKVMLTPEDLYEGLPKQTADAYRAEAVKKYGQQAVETAEKSLLKLSKAEIVALRKEQQSLTLQLFELRHEDPTSEVVQTAIRRHYIVTRKFWGTHGAKDPQWKQYAGLGQLYVEDERFTMVAGQPQPEFAAFLKDAMQHFVDRQQR